MVDGTRKDWEQRASECGTRLSGVLFRGLSQTANEALHQWHAWLVRHVFLAGIPEGGRILDLGCGYGRLSSFIREDRPDIEVIGQDFASEYCLLFRRNVGPCIQADATQLPFANGSFDAVLAVTCLMYVEHERVPNLLRNLHGLLRDGGSALFLDPGLELQTLISRVRKSASASPTGGRGFNRHEYKTMINNNGFSISACGGNPHISRVVLLPGMARSKSRFVQSILHGSTLSDCAQSGYTMTALHRWILARREMSA